MLTRRSLLLAAATTPFAAALATPVLAKTPEIYATGGVAIDGHDTVAFFTEGTHVKGDAAFVTNW